MSEPEYEPDREPDFDPELDSEGLEPEEYDADDEPEAEPEPPGPPARLVSLTSAEDGWKALFGAFPDEESQSRVLGWGMLDSGEIVGLVVDPVDRTRIVPAPDALSPEGTEFVGYGFRPPPQ